MRNKGEINKKIAFFIKLLGEKRGKNLTQTEEYERLVWHGKLDTLRWMIGLEEEI